MVRLMLNSGCGYKKTSNKAIEELLASLAAEDLHKALHEQDEAWSITQGDPSEDGEETWLITRGDSPGYQYMSDENKGYLVDNYSGYHFSSNRLEDFVDFIMQSERVVGELLDVIQDLDSSRLNAAADPKPFDPVEIAKQILLIARDKAVVPGLEGKIAWSRPTKVDRGRVMVKRKPGESDEEMERRRKSKSEWLEEGVSDASDVVVTQTLSMDKEWITKMALQLVFTGEEGEGSEQRAVRNSEGKSSFADVRGIKRELTAIFIPNHDPERQKAGIGSTENSAGSNKVGNFKDRTYSKDFTVIDTGNLKSDYSKLIFWTSQQLYDAVLQVFKYPPKRIVKRMFEKGLIKIKPVKKKMSDGRVVETVLDDDAAEQWLKELPKVSAFELVREGLVPGRDVLSTHPEWGTEMLNQSLIEPEELIRVKGNDPNTLYNMVKKGMLPAEKVVALAKDEKLTNRLIKDGLYSADAGTENTEVEGLVQDVASGKITPSKAWEINKNTLDPMLEKGLITPKEAYHLNPNGLASLMKKGYIGKAEGQKLSPQIKRRFSAEEWASLKASLHNLRRGRSLNASTAANFEQCVGDCDDPMTIKTLTRVGEFENNAFNEDNPAEWFNSLDDDAKNIVFSLVINWLMSSTAGAFDDVQSSPTPNSLVDLDSERQPQEDVYDDPVSDVNRIDTQIDDEYGFKNDLKNEALTYIESRVQDVIAAVSEPGQAIEEPVCYWNEDDDTVNVEVICSDQEGQAILDKFKEMEYELGYVDDFDTDDGVWRYSIVPPPELG